MGLDAEIARDLDIDVYGDGVVLVEGGGGAALGEGGACGCLGGFSGGGLVGGR